eukprot:6192053-Pleurochrysis_carterae.AAC.2
MPRIYIVYVRSRGIQRLSTLINLAATHAKNEASECDYATARNDATSRTTAPSAKMWCSLGMCCGALPRSRHHGLNHRSSQHTTAPC